MPRKIVCLPQIRIYTKKYSIHFWRDCNGCQRGINANADLSELLGRKNTNGRRGFFYRKAWKGYDFDILNQFVEKEIIGYQKHPSKSKSIDLTEEGMQLAQKMLKKYHIENESK